MRKLIVIPIVHTPVDMGSVKDSLRREGIAEIGKERWEENQRKIKKFWEEVEREIDNLNLDYKKVRIYQDGLPCGGELGLKIVSETAEKGSKNYQIVRKLIDKGATVEATESPDLLREEYRYIEAFAKATTRDEKADAKHRYDKIKDEVMEKRDTHIAKAIDETLKEDETGLLFIGAAHNIAPKLSDDIDVKNLD